MLGHKRREGEGKVKVKFYDFAFEKVRRLIIAANKS